VIRLINRVAIPEVLQAWESTYAVVRI